MFLRVCHIGMCNRTLRLIAACSRKRHTIIIYMKKLKLAFLIAALLLSAANLTGGEKIFSYRSFWPEFEAMKRFADKDINTVAFLPGNTCNSLGDPYSKYPNVWSWFDTYDFDVLDRQFDDILAANPNAEFVCIVDLNTPLWLARQLSSRGQSMECDSFTQLSNTVANPNWRKYVSEYLKKFLEHTEKKYGKKIKSYLLACGQTDEWMDYSRFSAARFKTAAWKKWLKEHGKEIVPVPNLERMDTATFENFIRDPRSESDIIDYVTFSSDIIADTIEEFAAITRKSISADKQIGMFFGYIVQLTGGRLVACGHLSYERIFSSPNIDYFVSPGSYYDRDMGQGSGFMCPNGSRLRSKKGWLHEIDHRTPTTRVPHLQVAGFSNGWKNQAEVDAGLKREFALTIVNQTSLWCFDMWGGFFDSPESMKVIGDSKKLWQKYANIEAASMAEVALIVDPQSAVYINDNNRKCGKPFVGMRTKLNALGAPFEVYSFNDIGKIDMERIKLFIFPAMFHAPQERLDVLQKHVFGKGKMALFIDAAGISDGKTLDVSRVEKLTGFSYKTKGINEKKFADHTRIYICDYDDVTADVLRKLAQKSGAKLYTDFQTPVYANDKLVAVHVAKGGKRAISLPKKYSKIVELYSGKTVAENADSFVYDFKTPDTALFELFE